MLGSDPIQFNEGEDEFDPNGEGFPTSSTDGADNNRPAANANLSDNVDATMEDFEFQEDADDFLGLEGEIDAMGIGGSVSEGGDGNYEVGDDGELNVSDGWLLEAPTPENTAPASVEFGAGAGVAPEEAEQVAEYVTDELASNELDGDFADDEYYDEEGEFDEEDYGDEFAQPAPSRAKLLAVAGFCIGIVGTISWLVLGGESADQGAVSEVATAPGGTATATQPANGGAGNVATSDGAETTAADTNTEDGQEIESVLDGLMATSAGPDTDTELEPIDRSAAPDLPSATEAPTAITHLPGVPQVQPSAPEDPVAQGPTKITSENFLAQMEEAVQSGNVRGFMDFRPESGDGFIWTGTEVPFDSIGATGRVLTPAVGLVRATMVSGELFEGNLYAVGDDRVWIELGPGRVGLDGGKVEKIQRITAESAAAEAASEAAPGQRVRIRTAGGVLYGKVKSREGDRVTIVTDKGARITLDDPEIEPIGRLSGLVLN